MHLTLEHLMLQAYWYQLLCHLPGPLVCGAKQVTQES